MAKYRIILNKNSDARRKNWWALPAWVWPNGGITFSGILVVVWNVSCKFPKIFPYTIHLAYYLSSCLFTLFAYLQRQLSPNKWLNNIPSPKGKRDAGSLVKLASHFRQHVLENQTPKTASLGFFGEHSQHSTWCSAEAQMSGSESSERDAATEGWLRRFLPSWK